MCEHKLTHKYTYIRGSDQVDSTVVPGVLLTPSALQLLLNALSCHLYQTTHTHKIYTPLLSCSIPFVKHLTYQMSISQFILYLFLLHSKQPPEGQKKWLLTTNSPLLSPISELTANWGATDCAHHTAGTDCQIHLDVTKAGNTVRRYVLRAAYHVRQ